MRRLEDVRNAINVLYSKKCGGGFKQLDVFADAARSLYVIRNKATGLEVAISSGLFSKEDALGVDREARTIELVKAFRMLGKPCKE